MFAKIFMLFLAYNFAKTQIYEKSDHLCETRCSCELSPDNRTLSIDCKRRGMKHTIANWPTPDPDRLVAVFSYNELTTLETMPGTNASDIKLVFSHCVIRYLTSGLFESTVNIKYLDLSYNYLNAEQLSPDIFKGPYKDTEFETIGLLHLDLSYNQIHTLQKDVFEHTPYLEVLDLEGNALRVIDHLTCLALAEVQDMKILNLAGNRLTEVPSDAIKHFPNLTTLDLSNNELDFVPDTLSFVAESLQLLNISDNPIIELTSESFEGMNGLETIYANNLSELTIINGHTFHLHSLKVLYLTHNTNLKQIDDTAFGNASLIEELYLNDNNLIRLHKNLVPWNQLRDLDIRGNQLICDCDLYNISEALSNDIKRDKDGPFCVEPRTLLSREVYNLPTEACNTKPFKTQRVGGSTHIYGNLRIMRITLTTLIVVLVIASSMAVWLAYAKWKLYQSNFQYHLPGHIGYAPVPTNPPRRY